LLFKAEDRGTGEDWAEVVACHLCGLLGLPHIEYKMAAEYDGEHYLRPGVVRENMDWDEMAETSAKRWWTTSCMRIAHA
jgi:hypothetical protein